MKLHSFHTLNIKPMKEVIASESIRNGVGFHNALHICRGHFKDYSKGAGLFGKNKGLYWWEMHMRGKADLGVVDKQFNIQKPDLKMRD